MSSQPGAKNQYTAASQVMDETQESVPGPSDRSPWYRAALDWLWNSWYPEIAALCLSLASLVAIAGVLIAFRNHFAPRLSYGLTLNAIISILATTSKVSLLYSTSNCLGQLKWIWFNGRNVKPISVAEIYDDASRGPLGAVQLLWEKTRNSLASIGAVLTILALAYDPFVQQIIAYAPAVRFDHSDAASIQTAKILSWQAFSLNKGNSNKAQDSMYASALWSFDLDWMPLCPTGNCFWDDHQSFAWCNTCTTSRTWTSDENCYIPHTAEEFHKLGQSVNVSDAPVYERHLEQLINATVISRTCTVTSNDGIQIPVDFNSTLAAANDSANVVWQLEIQYTPTAIELLTANWEVYDDAALAIFFAVATNQTQNLAFLFNITTPSFEFALLRLNVTSDMKLVATSSDCAVDVCMQTSEVNVTNGKVTTKVLDTRPTTKYYEFDILSFLYTVCIADDSDPEVQGSKPVLDGSESVVEYVQRLNVSSFCQDRGSAQIASTVDTADTDIVEATSVSWLGFNIIGSDTRTFGFWNASLNMSAAELAPWCVETVPQLRSVDGFTWDAEIDGPTRGSKFYSEGTNSSSGYAHILDTGFEYTMDNVAKAMTKNMLDPRVNVDGTTVLQGKLGSPTSLVTVQWPWVTLPAGLWVGAAIFLLLTMRKARMTKTPLWKSSLNALLYHGIDHDADVGPQNLLDTIPMMDKQAEKTKVRLNGRAGQRALLEPSMRRATILREAT